MEKGVSIVLCCHNSAKRLPDTIAFLAAQNVPASLPWEVIVVDNCSTDGTGELGSRLWLARSPVPLKIVGEDTPGLSNARRRGFQEARYGFISYVDDDNWLAPDWVRVASETLTNKPDMGACGGEIEAVCALSPPRWFETHKSSYAVGCQAPEAGDVTWTRGYVWGAGLTVRREALAQLFDRGFRPLLTDRSGAALTSGGDSELCLALRLAGWQLYYEPTLRLRHFLPAGRLNWNYLRRLHRSFGRARPVLDLYRKASLPERRTKNFREHWTWQAMSLLRSILTEHGQTLKKFSLPLEADPAILGLEEKIGRFTSLLSLREKLASLEAEIRTAQWRSNPGPRAFTGLPPHTPPLNPKSQGFLSVPN